MLTKVTRCIKFLQSENAAKPCKQKEKPYMSTHIRLYLLWSEWRDLNILPETYKAFAYALFHGVSIFR